MSRTARPCRQYEATCLSKFGMLFCLAAWLTGCAAPLPPDATRPVPPSTRSGSAGSFPSQPSGAPQPSPATGAPALPAQAAAPDQATQLREWVDLQTRLYRVAAPLLIHNTDLCPRHARHLLGFTAKNRYSYSNGFADTAQAVLGLGERLQIMNVLPGSGAEKAGLDRGDTLLAVEIEPLPQGPDAERTGAALIASELQGRESVSLGVLRNGQRMIFDIPSTPACAMLIDLGNTDLVASLADGQRIMITRGMLQQLPSDEELAYVLALEIARNILTEQAQPQATALIDRLRTLTPQVGENVALADLPVPPDTVLPGRELALYLLARAGYGFDGAPAFWQQMGNPDMTERELSALMETVGAIRAKQLLDVPLTPEER